MCSPTIGLEPFNLIQDWASAADVRAEFNLLASVLNVRTDSQREFFATTLDSMDVMEITLRRWELAGERTYGMAKLAWAWKRRPEVCAAIPRRVLEHAPNGYEFADDIRLKELFLDRDALFLVLQCQFPVGSDEQAQRDLRAWALIAALWHASQGHSLQDRLLAAFCTALRQAAYEVAEPKWRRALMPLGHGEASFAALTKRFEGMTRVNLLKAGRSNSEIRTLMQIAAYAGNETDSLPAESEQISTLAALHDAIESTESPGAASQLAESNEWFVEALPFGASGHDSRNDEDDGDSEDRTVVGVDGAASSARQALEVEFTRFQLGAKARFLPWDWDLPVPPERRAIVRLVSHTLENPPDQSARLLAALTGLALACALSLEQTMLIPMAPVDATLSSRYDWIVDLAEGVMRRLPMRRLGHWTPPSAAAGFLTHAANMLEIPIEPLVLEVLRVAASQSLGSRFLGQLWSSQRASVRSAFLDWVKFTKGTERLQSAMLQRVSGQVMFEATHNHVLSRLVSATRGSALPASTLYYAIRAGDLEHWHAGIVPVPATNEDINVGGSLLEPLSDGAIAGQFDRANQQTRERGDEGSWIGFHNRVVLHWDAALRAASGARPVQGLWSDFGQIDWQHGFAFIDDKSSPYADSGRLVPLPLELLASFELSYVKRHLPWVRAMLGIADTGAPPQESTPLLFTIQDWTTSWQLLPVSNADRRRFGIEAPLPLNVFRHRLRTQLHRQSAIDTELIDSVLGHGDGATLTHGDYSMRTWMRDADEIRPALETIYERLRIRPPPEWQEFGSLTTQQARPRPVSTWLDEHPDRQHANLTHQRAWFGAIRTIKRFLDNESARDIGIEPSEAPADPRRKPIHLEPPRPLDSILKQLSRLGTAQLDSLSRALLAQEGGMPSALGQLRYEFLLSLTEAAWDRFGLTIALGTRYVVRQFEASPFSASAPGSLALFDKLSAALDDMFAPVSARSGPSLSQTLCLAVFDLCLTSRISNRALLHSVIQDPDSWRVVRLDEGFFLEWSPGQSLVATPEASIQRFPISLRAAWLLDAKVQKSIRLKPAWLAGYHHAAPLTALLTGLPTPRDRDDKVSIDAVLDRCCRVTEQVNAIGLPGSLAGYLAGRVMSSSLAWGEWLHARTGRWFDTSPGLNDTAEVKKPGADLAKTRFARLDEELDEIALTKATRLRVATGKDGSLAAVGRTMAGRALVDAVHDRISGMEEAAGITRHRSEEAKRLAEMIHTNGNQVSSAVYLLCLWAIDMLLRPGRSRKLATNSVNRYFGALSPRLLKIAYDADIKSMDDEEIEALYADIIAISATAKIRQDTYKALRSFHSFARVAAGLPDIDWSDLAVRDGFTLASSGYIDEQCYLHIFERLGLDHSCRGAKPWQLQVILLLAYRFGLRGAEIFGLNRSDLVTTLDPVHVRVQRNRRPNQANYTSVKTTCSRRVVPLLFRLSEQEQRALELLEKSLVLASRTSHICPLFALPDNPEQPTPMADVRRHLNQVIKDMTGQRGLSLHDLRHAFASKTWALTQAPFIAWRDIGSVSPPERLKVLNTLLGPGSTTISRRSPWALARLLGHSHARRPLLSYVHGLGDAAQALVRVNRSTAQLGLVPDDLSCVSLNKFSDAPSVPERRIAAGSTPSKPSAALHALLFLSQGRTAQEAAAFTELSVERVDELERTSSHLFAALLAAPRSGLLKHALPRQSPTVNVVASLDPVPPVKSSQTATRKRAAKHQPSLPQPSQSVRMGDTGLLTFLHASAYERLRRGLSGLADKDLAHLRKIEPIRFSEWRAMIADRLEVSMWLPHHFEFFGVVLQALTEKRGRIELLRPTPLRQVRRAGAGSKDTLAQLAQSAGWLPVADSGNTPKSGREALCNEMRHEASLPTVWLEDDDIRVERRAVFKLTPMDDGVIFTRAEMLICALCINLFTSWQG